MVSIENSIVQKLSKHCREIWTEAYRSEYPVSNYTCWRQFQTLGRIILQVHPFLAWICTERWGQ
jgi:hypothetical protein